MKTETSSRPAPAATSPIRLLLGGLLALLALYFALRPWLQRTMAETERLDRLATEKQVEAQRLRVTRGTLDDARAAVALTPQDALAQLQLAEQCREAGLPDEAA